MPAFAAPQTNPFNLTAVGTYASPTLVDIDGDGDLDAFVGSGDGNTFYYRNTGTASAPVFAAPQTIPFNLTDVGNYASPTLVDIDGDGDLDAFVGELDGNTRYYRNTGTASAPAFAAPQINPFNLTDVGYTASPTFVDIDGDGDLDAFVGSNDGNTYYYRNTGTASAPVFAAPQTNPFNLTDVGNNASPTFVDIDGDGDLDAFVGRSNGDTFYYQNTGNASTPAFAAPQNNPFNLTDVGSYASPTFVDIDGDGDLDAFVGARDGNTYYYQDLLPGVSIAPGTTPSEAEPTAPVNGNFVVTLSAAATANTTINYTVSGKATPGSDYTALSGSVTILTGQTTANINVIPLLDNVSDPSETVQITLTAGTGYNLTKTKTAVLRIADNIPKTFAAPQTNPFNLTAVGTYASPTFVDIDSDGDLDAFVGARDGNTRYYQNTGTASAPVFAAPQTNPFNLTDVGYSASPTFVDIDGDGDLDAFVGAKDGNTFYYRNTGTASAPVFAAPQTNPFNLTDVGSFASPTFVDIDGDGDLDAFVGAVDGNTRYYQNTGTASAPVFAAPQTNPFNLTDVGSFASPTFVDIDGDGDLDAFVGAVDGNTRYYQNTGTASAPVFAAPQTNLFNLTNVGLVASPTFVDIDGDGDLDAFVGANDGNTSYYENAPIVSIAAGITPAEGGASGTFTITLNDIAPDGFTVAYTVGGTATNGTDYTTLSGTVTIPAGQTTATINVVPTDDAIVDPNETVTITLIDGAAYNLAAAPNNTASRTITDNDIAGVTITPTATPATEGGATGNYTAVLTSQPTGNVTLAIGNTSQTTTDAATLTFTSLNWN
ncbi:FG-GAP-like repeat-containing protein, partial [Microcoleus sp. Pol11C2]|uniref:FG-GAP-like repeat-containing protein n=1 Tax=Microcoleus sp. Pol11C2 TaxID=3055389 RepID=UPI002FD2C21B